MFCLSQAVQYLFCTGGQYPKLSPQMGRAETPQEMMLQSQHQPCSRAPVQGCAGSGHQQRIPHALFITILAEALMLHMGRRPRNVFGGGGGFREPPSPFAPYHYPCLIAVIFLLMVTHTKHKQGLPEGLYPTGHAHRMRIASGRDFCQHVSFCCCYRLASPQSSEREPSLLLPKFIIYNLRD